MEFLAYVGAAAIAYGSWIAFKFWNFRKRLLDAFEFHGLSRDMANDLYATHNAAINDLHVNKGLSPELIALSILAELGREITHLAADYDSGSPT